MKWFNFLKSLIYICIYIKNVHFIYMIMKMHEYNLYTVNNCAEKQLRGGEWAEIRVFIIKIIFSFYGRWRGLKWQIISLVFTRKFLAGWLRLCFWEWFKQQLGQVLNLSLDSWDLAQLVPFWACDFLFEQEGFKYFSFDLFSPNLNIIA